MNEAERCLADYALRWRIEDWHRVLKTGCRVEELAHQRVERLERAIAINLVVTVRSCRYGAVLRACQMAIDTDLNGVIANVRNGVGH